MAALEKMDIVYERSIMAAYNPFQMAMNVAALPVASLSEFLERCGALSPLHDFGGNVRLLVSPHSSNESPVSSSSSDPDENTVSQNLMNQRSIELEDDGDFDITKTNPKTSTPVPSIQDQSFWNEEIKYQGRDILDLAGNFEQPFPLQYAKLPNNNLSMFMANRSQYHRLSSSGHIREYDLGTCHKCSFQFPVSSLSTDSIHNFICTSDAKDEPTEEESNEKDEITPSFNTYKHFCDRRNPKQERNEKLNAMTRTMKDLCS